MTDQARTLRQALEARYAPSSDVPRGGLNITALDPSHESIEAAADDPDLYARLGGRSIGHAIYLRDTKAIADDFIFDQAREDDLARRDAGESLDAELAAEVSSYERRRAVAIARNTFDEARKEAMKP